MMKKRGWIRMMLCGLMVLIAAGCQVDTPRLTTNTTRIAQLAAEIADFEPPAGYAPEYGGTWQGTTLVAYHVGNGPRHLMFLQVEEGSDLAEMSTEAALAEVTSDDSYYSGLDEIEVREVVIRGETTSMVVSEGVNGEGLPYRQVTAPFTGNGGPALMSLTGPIDGWDWDMVDAFLASIR